MVAWIQKKREYKTNNEKDTKNKIKYVRTHLNYKEHEYKVEEKKIIKKIC